MMYNSELMSYYTLPTINNNIILNPSADDNPSIEPYISHSLFNYYNELHSHAYNIKVDIDASFNSYEDICEIVNTHEYIFSKVPGSKFSVSKLKTKSILFYDLIEITATLNIFDFLDSKKMNTLHISKNYNDSIESLKVLRDNNEDEINFIENIEEPDTSKCFKDKNYNFLFFETSSDSIQQYIRSFMYAIMSILKYQCANGISIIKITHTFHKPIIDMLYFLTSIYEKVYIIKPSSSNATTFEKYIICNDFILSDSKINHYKLNYYKLFVFLKKNENKNIVSVLDTGIPYYFISKLIEMNNIIGQPQLESLDQIISVLRSKNKEEKIETLRKANIQKSIKWCEKYKIPCNKFTDKLNMFLPIYKDGEINNPSIDSLNESL